MDLVLTLEIAAAFSVGLKIKQEIEKREKQEILLKHGLFSLQGKIERLLHEEYVPIQGESIADETSKIIQTYELGMQSLGKSIKKHRNEQENYLEAFRQYKSSGREEDYYDMLMWAATYVAILRMWLFPYVT